MKNTVILEEQEVVHCVIEPQMGEDAVHSVWRRKEDAEEIAAVFNVEENSTTIVRSFKVDDTVLSGLGYQVLISLNSGEQVEDDLVSMNDRCVYYENEPIAYQHNFVMFDDPSHAAIEGENPRKIDGEWVVHHNDELSWEDFLKRSSCMIELEECHVFGTAPTKEEALSLAKQKRLELLEELERKNALYSQD